MGTISRSFIVRVSFQAFPNDRMSAWIFLVCVSRFSLSVSSGSLGGVRTPDLEGAQQRNIEARPCLLPEADCGGMLGSLDAALFIARNIHHQSTDGIKLPWMWQYKGVHNQGIDFSQSRQTCQTLKRRYFSPVYLVAPEHPFPCVFVSRSSVCPRLRHPNIVLIMGVTFAPPGHRITLDGQGMVSLSRRRELGFENAGETLGPSSICRRS